MFLINQQEELGRDGGEAQKEREIKGYGQKCMELVADGLHLLQVICHPLCCLHRAQEWRAEDLSHRHNMSITQKAFLVQFTKAMPDQRQPSAFLGETQTIHDA